MSSRASSSSLRTWSSRRDSKAENSEVYPTWLDNTWGSHKSCKLICLFHSHTRSNIFYTCNNWYIKYLCNLLFLPSGTTTSKPAFKYVLHRETRFELLLKAYQSVARFQAHIVAHLQTINTAAFWLLYVGIYTHYELIRFESVTTLIEYELVNNVNTRGNCFYDVLTI